MKSRYAAVMVFALVSAIAFALARMQRNDSAAPQAPAEQKIPPLPPGVTELKFSEFFVSPIGPRGLQFTEKLSGLDGKRVRLLGYMVRQEGGLPGKFLFTAIPVQLHDHDSALADDLPPAVVHATVPTCLDRAVPYAPGLMLLTGTLNIGPREEADGRMSIVRLALDPPARGERDSSFIGKLAGFASSDRSPAR
jgi:hypothetical protein